MVTLDREVKENVIENTRKERDVEHKIKEAEGLERTLTKLSSDEESAGKVGEQDVQKCQETPCGLGG